MERESNIKDDSENRELGRKMKRGNDEKGEEWTECEEL
jgi:hypothetical protein